MKDHVDPLLSASLIDLQLVFSEARIISRLLIFFRLFQSFSASARDGQSARHHARLRCHRPPRQTPPRAAALLCRYNGEDRHH